MAFYLKTETAIPKTHGRRFSCRPENAYRGLRVENLGLRFYNPSIGRWASRDPIWERGSISLYSFVFNSPFCFVDPNGREPLSTDLPPAQEVIGEGADWAGNIASIYQDHLVGVIQGTPKSSAWVSSIVGGLMQIGWGIMLDKVGSEMEKVSKHLVVCYYYYLVRFVQECSADQSTLVKTAPQSKRGEVLSWIKESGGAQQSTKGYGYRAFTFAQGGKLLYMQWKDSPDAQTAWVQWASPRFVPSEKPYIRFGQFFGQAYCCSNKGLVSQ